MSKTIITYASKNFSKEDIELIKWTREKYSHLSITELAATVCEFLDWTTPAGRVKRAQCISFLRKLSEENIITIPPVSKMARTRSVHENILEINIEEKSIEGLLKEYLPITLELVPCGDKLKLWKAYINKYHMLGYKQAFGSRLHYFIKSQENILGCIQFSASSWGLKSREEWIGWKEEDRKKRLHLIVNNSRFLIFPWVKIKYLASHVLSIAVKQVTKDWLNVYCYAPVLFETFVDTTNFKGTCYKAANWTYLGKTVGGKRIDRLKDAGYKKDIYMYPVNKKFKEILRGEIAYEVINDDK